jgi:hypothetical protein
MIQCHPTEITTPNEKNINQNHHEKWLQTINKQDQKTTQIAIRTHVEDTLLLHLVLQQNPLLTLVARNERELASVAYELHGARGTGSGRHLLTILIFINYYKNHKFLYLKLCILALQGAY